MKRIIIRLTLSTIVSIGTFGCASTSFLGDWDYTVTGTPDGNLIGLFTLSETEDGYVCHVLSSDGYADFDMESCKLEENTLTGFYYDEMGSRIDISGTFEEDKFTGKVNVQGQEFTLAMVRKEE